MGKLAVRNVELHRQWNTIGAPACHPLFQVHPGEIETWERQGGKA